MFIPYLDTTLLLILASCSILTTRLIHAFEFVEVTQPNIDYDSFNDKLSILGDFNSVSFYDYVGQSNQTSSDDYNQFYVINTTNSQYLSLFTYTGIITSFETIGDDSVLLIGDFNINNYTSPVIYNSTTDDFVEIQEWSDRVQGDIMSTFYDDTSNLIYFGGDLSCDDEIYGLVVYDLANEEIIDSPFRGFNEDSTVNAIIKIMDQNDDDDTDGSIIFGGFFNNLGDENLLIHKFTNSTTNTSTNNTSSSNISNTSITVDPEYVVSLKYATISSVNTDSSSSSADSAIICPDNEATWLINDQNVGSWTASLPFDVNPTKLRLYNSIEADTGVHYFRVITSPTDGIMNMTYIDPTTQNLAYCDAWCPLQNVTYMESIMNELDSNFYSVNSTLTTGTIGFGTKYQEFAFVNSVGVTAITVQVMSSFGTQAGLSGFQLYQSGSVTYANDSLNEPNCGEANDASADLQGSDITWDSFTSQDGSYLTTTIATSDFDSSSSSSNKIGVTFYPNVTYSGDYSVLIYTPGCNYDNTCSERGIVNVTLTNGNGEYLTSKLIYQTNEEEKYDTIYSGHLDVDDGIPYIDMFLSQAGSDDDEIVLVADRTVLNLLSVDQTYYYNNTNSTDSSTNETETLTIPINGLFEYSLANFSNFDNSMDNVSTNGTTNVYVGNSSINLIGSTILSEDAIVNGLAVINNTLYIAGEFESDYGDNFIAAALNTYNETSNSTSVEDETVIDGGLDGTVSKLFLYDNDTLIIVGDFDNTENTTTINNLNSTTDDETSITNLALYNGSWYSFTDGSSASINTFTNITFEGIEYFIFNGDNSTSEVWDNTNEYWISNDDSTRLNISIAVSLGDYIFAAGQQLSGESDLSDANGGAIVSDPELSSMPFELTSTSDGSDILTALYLNSSVTVYGGQFNTTDGLQNLVFVDSDNNTYGIQDNDDTITWDDDTQVVKLLEADDDSKLFIGLQNGGVTIDGDTFEGLFAYDLTNETLSSEQPASLSSDTTAAAAVYAMVASSSYLYVGGDFTNAGSLSCESICSYDLSGLRWSNPLSSSSNSLSGTVYQMTYYSSSKILVAGNMSIDDDNAAFAVFDTDKSTIEANDDLNNNGLDSTVVIKSFILVDEDSITNRVIAMGDQFLSYYNSSSWVDITDDLDLDETTFHDIQLVDLSEKNSDNDGTIFGSKQILMVSGLISHSTYGNFSTGFYNGTSWIPYLFTNSGSTGVQTALQNKANTSSSSSNYSLSSSVMKVRNVVGVAFACALGSLLLVVLSYCLYYFLVGKNKNYGSPMEARVAEKDMLETVPPSQLINSLDHAKYLAD